MKRFDYVHDRLFVAGCLCYAANRWFVKPHLQPTEVFLNGYFNDFWLIACALPPILLFHRKLGLRPDDGPPTWKEVVVHLLVWSVVVEVIGPTFYRGAIGDPWDVAAYAIGGLLAWTYWNHRDFRTQTSDG